MDIIKKVNEMIFSTVDELNHQLPKTEQLEKNLETELFGGSGKLDSLGLVNLIVAVEEAIEDEFDLSITLANEEAKSQTHSPFRTLATLNEYVVQ